MVCVFPGCADVLANDFLFINALIRDDFPTGDFHAFAISGVWVSGSGLVEPLTVSKFTSLIIMISPAFHILMFLCCKSLL